MAFRNKYVLILALWPCLSFSQEFVRNGSFENKHWLYPLTTLQSLKGWFNPNNGTPDVNAGVYHVSGNIRANSGERFIGIAIDIDKKYNKDSVYTEYVANILNKALEKNKLYRIALVISKSDKIMFIPRSISFGFTKNRTVTKDVNFINGINFHPLLSNDTNYLQTEKKWVQVYGYYRATGGEKYLYIGYTPESLPLIKVNRKKNGRWSFISTYYFIDDVSVQEVQGSSVYDEDKIRKDHIEEKKEYCPDFSQSPQGLMQDLFVSLKRRKRYFMRKRRG